MDKVSVGCIKASLNAGVVEGTRHSSRLILSIFTGPWSFPRIQAFDNKTARLLGLGAVAYGRK